VKAELSVDNKNAVKPANVMTEGSNGAGSAVTGVGRSWADVIVDREDVETVGEVGGSAVVEETDGLAEVVVGDGGIAGAALGADWVGVGC
jgi:hypothetical protein